MYCERLCMFVSLMFGLLVAYGDQIIKWSGFGQQLWKDYNACSDEQCLLEKESNAFRSKLVSRAVSLSDINFTREYTPWIEAPGLEDAIEDALHSLADDWGVVVLLSPPGFGKSARARKVPKKLSYLFSGILRYSFENYRPGAGVLMDQILHYFGGNKYYKSLVEVFKYDQAGQRPYLIILDQVDQVQPNSLYSFQVEIAALATESSNNPGVVVYLLLSSNQTLAERVLMANGGYKTRATIHGKRMRDKLKLSPDSVHEFIGEKCREQDVSKSPHLNNVVDACVHAGIGPCRAFVRDFCNDNVDEATLKEWRVEKEKATKMLQSMSMFRQNVAELKEEEEEEEKT